MNRNQTYNYYKMCEKIADKAAESCEYLKAEHWYLEAAKWRLIFRDNHNGGYWDAGHKAHYDCLKGSAWIQREAYEDNIAIDQICYERKKSKTPKWSVWKKKHTNIMKDNFESLMKQHQKIKKARKLK